MTESSENFDRFSKLLGELQKLPPLENQPKTFLGISGFPHYELVCSNILKFFFDPREPHKLGDLVMKSLLEVYDEKSKTTFAKKELQFSEVIREERTRPGSLSVTSKSIDLMIVAKPVLVGIENKLHHEAEQNPYEIYSEHLKKKAEAEDIPNVIKILLSLKSEEESGKFGFVPITYEEFFKRINLDRASQSCDQRFLPFLIDFMDTIKNQRKEIQMDDELLKFFKDDPKQETVSVEFFGRLELFAKLLRSKIKSVSAKIPSAFGSGGWYWCSLQKSEAFEKNLYDSINFNRGLANGKKVTVQVSISARGWEVGAYDKEWKELKPLGGPKKFSFEESEDKVVAACINLLKKIANSFPMEK